MATDAPFIKPKAPFVIVTRKGGFPAATLVEAQRVVRPLVTDEKTSITDAAGRKYTAREFLNAAQQAAEASSVTKAPLPTDLKDWASATADIDLDGEAPPGWTPPPPPPTPSRGVPSAARSSGRIPSPGARGRPTSDRRPSGARRRDEEGSGTRVLLAVGILVLAVGIIAAIWSLQARPTTAPTPPEVLPATRPTTPAQPTLTPDGRVRPEDRPLPTYMR